MREILKIIKRIIILLSRFLFFIPVLAIVVFLVFLFGNTIIGPKLPGSDNANFINLAQWLSNWFPRIPFWYPQQGGGISFTISYPILNHLIVAILEKISQQPIAVVFRVWSLVVVVLSSIGLFLLAFRLTKNQVVSSLAAIFYPLMPITWIFLIGWGFAAEQLSLMFIPPVLIFNSLFLDEIYNYGLTVKAKIYFLLFILLFAVLPFAHPLVFVGVLMLVMPLFIIYPLVNRFLNKPNLKKIFLVTFISGLIMSLSVFYWVLPFFRYQQLASQGAPVQKAVYDHRAFLQDVIYPLSVFSITDRSASYENIDSAHQNVSGGAWHNVSFPFGISLLALIGLTGSFFINRKVFAFGVANLFPLIITIIPEVTYYLLSLPFSGYFLNWRATIITSRFIIPLLAAFGCYVIAYLFTFYFNSFSKKLKWRVLKFSLRLIFLLISSILTILIAVFVLWVFKAYPNKYPDFLLSYGPEITIPSQRIDLRDIWRLKVNTCFNGGILPTPKEMPLCYNYQLQKNFWDYELGAECQKLEKSKIQLTADIGSVCSSSPNSAAISNVINDCDNKKLDIKFKGICEARTKSLYDQIQPEIIKKVLARSDLYGEGQELFYKEREIAKALPDDHNTRVDVGTSLGAFMMFEPFYSNVPELPVYYNQSTLMKNMWNYQIAIFNQKDTVWQEDSIMYELSKYFGLGYTIFSEDLVPLDKFKRTGWERAEKWKTGSFAGLALWKFNDAVGLLRATTVPTVLVVGHDKVDSYFRIFHLANLGVLPFEEGLLVKGTPYADDYSVEELSNFDLVILEGYQYKNRNKAWSNMQKYIENGGSVLINTGWQYASADWKLDKAPDFFPMNKLGWQEVGNAATYINEDTAISGDIDVSQFSPLIYDKVPWSISSSDRSEVKNWAKVVLSAEDKPLVAGGVYGQGKILWMGVDLPGHIGAYKNNPEEIKFYKNLVTYLLGNKEKQIIDSNFTNDYPDRFEITINGNSDSKTAVYFSEAYYPDFKANLISDGKSQGIKTYKAGPGMTMFILPNANKGSKIIYEYQEPIIVPIAKLISLFTFVLIFVIIIRPQFVSKILRMFTDRIDNKKLRKKIFLDHKDEDLDY